jgi:hypothetical protein
MPGWVDLLGYFVLVWAILGVTGLLPETILGMRVWWKRRLDKMVPPEQRALLKEQDKHNSKKEQLKEFERKIDEYNGKLKSAVARATAAKLAYDTKRGEAGDFVNEKDAQLVEAYLVEVEAAKEAWELRSKVAEEYKKESARLSREYLQLVSEIRTGELKLDAAEARVVLATAKRLGNDLDEHTRSLAATAAQPNENMEIIDEALHTEEARSERLAGTDGNEALKEKRKQKRLDTLAKELGITRPASETAGEETAALPPPSEVPMAPVTVSVKEKVAVPVKDKKAE